MEDGVTTANTGPTHRTQENGFRCTFASVCSCICMRVGVYMKYIVHVHICSLGSSSSLNAAVAVVIRFCHSPLLDQ